MSQPNGRTDVTRSAILAQIGAQGPTSRAELARVLAVSPALITQLCKQLIADGLLTELEFSPSQGGRPARLLGLQVDAGTAIGVKVAADHLTIVEVGLDGSVARSATEPFDAADSDAIPNLTQALERFIDGSPAGPLLGIGIGVPGSVDRQADGIVDSTQLGWSRMPVGPALRRALGVPVLVENNVNALAVAETLHGQARGFSDALVVTIGTGIGAGIVTDGVVLRGHRGGAGEIGHIPVSDGGPRCQCGANGCLEAHIGQDALIAQARAAGVIGAAAGMPDLRLRADRGGTGAREVFAEAGLLLGRALAGVVNTVDPEILIVLGEGAESWRHWSESFEKAFRAQLMPSKRELPIAVESWQDDRWAQGAASLVLATPFDAQGLAGEQGRLVRDRLAAR
ncbi:ROK family transcriptional regulator [Diaminobutyricimonas sp. TR449]|uniref:ROK family transcriptional regulator n=1 Tax=Diaminobutyricimonas sp. TR449 TaxID=2708076 RepID=UPI00142058D6|nr:ROK family transcriptional regulator [Diaminobutyricimonas sp. TR449]